MNMVTKLKRLLMLSVTAAFLSTGALAQSTLFFSEYLEGSSSNKALEIYNPTDAEVDLSNYRLYRANNGADTPGDSLDLAGTLAAGAVYVIGNPSADQSILDESDTTHTITFYNGDDFIGLYRNDGGTWTLLDVIGVLGEDPGSSWDVAGVTGATNEQTLLRKPSITAGQTDWALSAGTDAASSEWWVLAQNDSSNIGAPSPAFLQPEPPYEVGDNIVANGSFDAFALGDASTSLNWSYNKDVNGANATMEIVDGAQDEDSRALKVNYGTYNGGADDWNVEAVNEPFNVVEGETYKSSVWIKADTDTRVANLYFNLPASGNWARYEQTKVTLSTEWTEYTQVHTASAADVAASMRYSASLNFTENTGGTIWIDNLTITKLEDPVSVTFNVNTATMPDTLMDDHVLQIRGGTVGPDQSGTGLGSMITWDAASLVTDNVGGDYWSITFNMSRGDTLNYKFWAGVDTNTPLINGGEQGWESGDNNQFILPWNATADTTAPLQWYETREAPFTSEEDSVTVYFRVNVGGQVQTEAFDPETGKVGVRGNPAFFDNPGDWSSTGTFLENLGGSGDNLFYGGYHRIHEDSVANIDGEVGYKFVLYDAAGDVTWESTPDEFTAIPDHDTTTYWKFFSDIPPSNAVIVDTDLSFEVNVGILEGLGLFNSSIDTVSVRGTFNSWGENRMNFNQLAGTYEANNIEYTAAEGGIEQYKYYIKWDERRDSSDSEFYLEGIQAENSGWEEPGVTGGADRVFTIENKASQDKLSEFYNGVEPAALLTSNNVNGGATTVTFSIDMSPATTTDDATKFNPASDSVFLFVDTPFFALTNGITVPGDNGENFITQSQSEIERLMFTDGDGDMVYELVLDLTLPTLNHIGFRIAYGEPTSADGQLVANGGGFAAGRRHYQYIMPQVDAQGNVTWPSSYSFSQLTWKFDDLPFELPPDYTLVSNEGESEIVGKFSLEQNYPNPFNPSTNISFNLPNAANVNLTVYNLLGQKVATLINGKTMTSGSHSVAFNASALSSGVYLYRLEAGSFVSNKRMTLIK